MEENESPEKPGRTKIPFELIISTVNFLIATAQVGLHLKIGTPSGLVMKVSRFTTSAVLLVPAFKILYQLHRFVRDHGVRKMNRVKILWMVAYLLALFSGIAFLFVKPNMTDLKGQAMIVSMASLLGMVISCALLDYKHLPKRNYIDYLIIFSCLVFIVMLASLLPPLKKHDMVSKVAAWGSMATGLIIPVLQSLLSPGSISEPVSYEDFAMFNVLSIAILALSIAAVASPHVLEWYDKKPRTNTARTLASINNGGTPS
ncbi:hypothetical protein EROM_060740 [Encephalitozoon romaleae SJ-2008]|uniref:Uncharacterized protein n=1 Tax=Encephalitozoon romaleae (strain SJ-2008) TaxID=1178016 RepID=I7AS20_ENCRO|nr:hypothetical protein EROM_060740 [Encephalitozoon romaleae SJ-2008]AFN83167.1 hypothetical protein EROM_060740 [Encephalitozoon romaleae SJ-2008]